MDKNKFFNDLKEELIKLTNKNKDLIDFNNRSVVACALVTKDLKVFTGLNVAWWHSSCAEVVALGNGLQNGERKFEYLLAVKLNKRNMEHQVLTPCGICREMFMEFEQGEMQVVSFDKKGKVKLTKIKDMLPE